MTRDFFLLGVWNVDVGESVCTRSCFTYVLRLDRGH